MLFEVPASSAAAYALYIFLTMMILVSIANFVLSTMQTLQDQQYVFDMIEYVCTVRIIMSVN